MFCIDDELKEFLESEVAAVVCTADSSNRPHVVQGWGLRVLPGRTAVQFFIERPRVSQARSDVEQTGRVAVTVGHPISYRSVQLKGSVVGTSDASPEDERWVQRHREGFASSMALVGDPAPTIRNLWMEGVPLVRFEFTVERAFDQTPGPNAGTPL